MLVKQKLSIYDKNKAEMSISSDSVSAQDYSTKADNFMEHYLWKYVDKIDDKLEMLSDQIISQIDKYVVGEQPESFEP